MTLAISTDLTVLNDADAGGSVWIQIGTTSIVDETDTWVQRTAGSGAGCISKAVSGAVTKGAWYNRGSGLNFASGGAAYKMLIFMWLRCNTPKLIQTLALGGLSIRLGTTTTDYNEYYVGGSDYGIPDSDGWVMYVIDPSQTRSTYGGAGLTLSSIQYFGATITTTGTAKGQNFAIDQICYGRGEIRVSGTVAVAGAGFKEIADWDWGTKSRRYGMIIEKAGTFFCRCKFVLGDAVAAAGLTFSSQAENLVWETPMYYNGTSRVKAVPDEDAAGLCYWGLDVVGNATTPSGDTVVTFGVAVGTDRGRSGPSFSVAANPEINSGSTRQGWRLTRTAAVEDFDLYATTFKNCERADEANAIDFTNCDVSDEIFGTTFDACGRVYLGAAKVRNCNILNSIVGTLDGAVKWDNSTNCQSSLFVNPAFHSIVVESTPSPTLTFTNLTFGTVALAVRYEGASNTVVAIVGGTTGLTAENAGAGTMTFSSSVDITLTIVDQGAVAVIDARVGVYDATTNDEYMNTLSVAPDGIASGSYPGSTPKAVTIRVRKTSVGSTRYVPISTPSTIPATGLVSTIALSVDPNL